MSASQPLRVRAGRSGDVEDLLALEANFPGDRMSRRSLRHLLSAPTARVWVIAQQRQVVAAAIVLLRRGSYYGRIYSVVVAPQCRGRGLARQLLRYAERDARSLKLRGLSLEVRVDNTAARTLYRDLGYVETQVLEHYYEDGCDGVRLRREFATD
ncbi:GNAT family N-acetyltransferase [Sinimarinibacterium sp. CAU 1509]|uniref:GNAT family N-acetyltransferase n=1 Tax=Sinimarinibacterium sp. CAU 1509 TaxID=2562283 RepID=UPI0010AD598A|nr:GNAT family N-acetyltransferase [Sinimarinibacterium sp. CAU 1509]TJY59794.1 GNAT family N-acetyltransferase [Sinimarinibacterium sp. CAU 1509]